MFLDLADRVCPVEADGEVGRALGEAHDEVAGRRLGERRARSGLVCCEWRFDRALLPLRLLAERWRIYWHEGDESLGVRRLCPT